MTVEWLFVGLCVVAVGSAVLSYWIGERLRQEIKTRRGADRVLSDQIDAIERRLPRARPTDQKEEGS